MSIKCPGIDSSGIRTAAQPSTAINDAATCVQPSPKQPNSLTGWSCNGDGVERV